MSFGVRESEETMALSAPRRILAATDFSDLSTGALRHAVMWAERFGAELIVLYVAEIPWLIGDFGSVDGLILAQQREEADRQLAAYVASVVPPGLLVTHEVGIGAPAEVIETRTIEAQADLVVLGTHGRGGFDRLLLGSVAERVLHAARQPTLIVHPPPEQAAPGSRLPAIGFEAGSPEPGARSREPHLTHILCPVNDTEIARTAFVHAVAVAQTFGARLTAVFVVEQEAATPESVQRGEALLRAWLPDAVTAGYEVQSLVRHGDAAEQILTLAREAAADLVVIGAQHRLFADTTVLGVTTVRVTRHAPCPVLVVPQSPPG